MAQAITNEQWEASLHSLEEWYEDKICKSVNELYTKLAERDVEICNLEAEARETRRLLRLICRRLKIKMNEKTEEYEI
jgi:hypothetical protein